VLDRVLAFGDAWFPNYAPEGILERAAELRSRAGRPVDLMVMGVPADAKVLDAYANAGFRRAVHWLPSAPRGPVERALDRYEAALADLHGGQRARPLHGAGGDVSRQLPSGRAAPDLAAWMPCSCCWSAVPLDSLAPGRRHTGRRERFSRCDTTRAAIIWRECHIHAGRGA
jgi:hypothetical protein